MDASLQARCLGFRAKGKPERSRSTALPLRPGAAAADNSPQCIDSFCSPVEIGGLFASTHTQCLCLALAPAFAPGMP